MSQYCTYGDDYAATRRGEEAGVVGTFGNIGGMNIGNGIGGFPFGWPSTCTATGGPVSVPGFPWLGGLGMGMGMGLGMGLGGVGTGETCDACYEDGNVGGGLGMGLPGFGSFATPLFENGCCDEINDYAKIGGCSGIGGICGLSSLGGIGGFFPGAVGMGALGGLGAMGGLGLGGLGLGLGAVGACCEETEQGTENVPSRRVLLKAIQELGFTLTDLVQYLDTHPTCVQALIVYASMRFQYQRLVCLYEFYHGPLVSHNVVRAGYGCQNWEWVSSAWPWEMEG